MEEEQIFKHFQTQENAMLLAYFIDALCMFWTSAFTAVAANRVLLKYTRSSDIAKPYLLHTEYQIYYFHNHVDFFSQVAANMVNITEKIKE